MLKHALWVLRRDSFDIMMVHEANWEIWGFDYETGDSVVFSVLEELKKEGVVQNIGIGLWKMDTAVKLVKTGRIDAILIAGGMNLLERPMFDELVPAALEHNTGVTLGGALGQNNPLLVVKDYDRLETMLHAEDEREVIAGQKLQGLYEITEELGCDMIELAMRYVLSFEEIHCHVPGARCIEHLQKNIASGENKAYNQITHPANICREKQ